MSQSTPSERKPLSKDEKKRILAEESAILSFTEELLRRMEETGVNKTTLAKRLDVDPAFISKLIGGENNFTIKTMVGIARALQSRLRLALTPLNPTSNWTISVTPKLSIIQMNYEPASTNRVRFCKSDWKQYEYVGLNFEQNQITLTNEQPLYTEKTLSY